MNLRQRFERVNSSGAMNAVYVILHGWDGMPDSSQKDCMILCQNRSVFAQEFGLDVRSARSRIGTVEGIDCRFLLVQKGSGLFAETFDSEVLARRTMNGVLSMPSADHHALILMSFAIRYDDNILQQREVRRVVSQYITRKVGIGRRIGLYDFSTGKST